MNWEDFYELDSWKGMDMWQCKVCPHSTTGGIKEILAHVGGHFPARIKRELMGTEESADVLDTVEIMEWITDSTIDAADEEE